jgi:hypothetical protein
MVDVRGEVNLDNRALPGARILFVPENPNFNQNFTISYGLTDARGEFFLHARDGHPGAIAGKHRVYVSRADFDKADMPPPILDPSAILNAKDIDELSRLIAASTGPAAGELVPFFYNAETELICQVVPGRGIQRVRFDLSSVDPLLQEPKRNN